MPIMNHVNIPDKDNQIYCCLRNRVVTLNAKHQKHYCSTCKMYNGNAKGTGVECLWDDIREASQTEIVVTNPNEEYASNQKRKVKTVFLCSVPVLSV